MKLQDNNKMETKFNIGDEIYFMDFSEPKKSKIKGIALVTGDFNDSNFRLKTNDGEYSVLYSVGSYSSLHEDKLFKSKEDLQEYVFANL